MPKPRCRCLQPEKIRDVLRLSATSGIRCRPTSREDRMDGMSPSGPQRRSMRCRGTSGVGGRPEVIGLRSERRSPSGLVGTARATVLGKISQGIAIATPTRLHSIPDPNVLDDHEEFAVACKAIGTF